LAGDLHGLLQRAAVAAVAQADEEPFQRLAETGFEFPRSLQSAENGGTQVGVGKGLRGGFHAPSVPGPAEDCQVRR
jgi:hypothetical protein